MKTALSWFTRPRNYVLAAFFILAYFLSQNDAMGAAVGMTVFTPVKALLAVLITSILVNTWLSSTVDADKVSGRMKADWDSLPPAVRATLTCVLLSVIFLGVCIITAASK